MKRMIIASSIEKPFRVNVLKSDGWTTLWKKFSTRAEATEFIYKLKTQARYRDYRRDKCAVTMEDLITGKIIKEIQLDLH